MTVRRWCVAVAAVAIGFGAAGYVGGREHVKHELRTELRAAMEKAGQEFETIGKRWADDIKRQQSAAEARQQQKGGGR